MILKIKDWKNNNSKQFEIIQKYQGIIYDVRRIKDNKIIKSGYFYNLSYIPDATFMIYEFEKDLIHVKYEILAETIEKIQRIGRCPINALFFNSNNTLDFILDGN